jgi:hypothetical protein
MVYWTVDHTLIENIAPLEQYFGQYAESPISQINLNIWSYEGPDVNEIWLTIIVSHISLSPFIPFGVKGP